ncbi:HCN4 [Symbiodinium pilosum]|uniref:HCN4 protein n=1 Tax=Symbiodinium pilosum TaxID=2952 RepID=A0A812IUX1_SYMPI|nr:HCN4 [Symbiodinium pilosum]
MLKRIDFFRNFGPAFLDELLSSPESIRKVLVMPGTVLLREGTPGDSMMVVSKGRVAASVNGRVVKHLGEGSYFGELVFLGAALVRTATVTATTFCDVRIIYNRSFKRTPCLSESAALRAIGARGLGPRMSWLEILQFRSLPDL